MEKPKIKLIIRNIGLSLPVIVLYTVLILGGMILVSIQSLGYIPTLNLKELSFDSYISVIKETRFLKGLVFSIFLASVSTFISIIMGLSLARYLLTLKGKIRKGAWLIFSKTMIILPYLYVILLVIITFSRSGYLSRLLYNLGIISNSIDFPSLVYDKFGIGIIMVYVLKGFPFVTLFIFNVMKNIPLEYLYISASLGANYKQAFKKVYVPLASTTIIWCSCVLFAYFLGSLEVPILVGSLSSPTSSSELYSFYLSPQINDIPKAMAMNIMLFIVGIICTIFINFLLKKLLLRRYNEK